MGKFITNFATTAEYNAAESGLIKPHVSLTRDNMNVHYLPQDPYAGHDYVEIGGLKWATMNIGATAVTDNGLYFQWGDTQGYTADQVGSADQGKKYFYWDDYKYCSGASTSSSAMTKYNSTDGKTVLESSDDAAQANWGGSWRMPTTEEYLALGQAVNTAWTQVNGVYGMQCTDKNDSSKVLFFPAVGGCFRGSVGSVGSSGYCWSSSLFSSSSASGRYLYFNGSSVDWQGSYNRCLGCAVRGVVG